MSLFPSEVMAKTTTKERHMIRNAARWRAYHELTRLYPDIYKNLKADAQKKFPQERPFRTKIYGQRKCFIHKEMTRDITRFNQHMELVQAAIQDICREKGLM